VLTLTNPMTILSFVAIFAGAGVAVANDRSSAAWLVGGVFFGSAAWWLILSALAGSLGGRLERGGLRIVNLVAGLVVAGYGVWQLVTWR
jgi:threonine/homoserine/homoserine lactone efflux protein